MLYSSLGGDEFLFVNEQCMDVTGYSEEELYSMDQKELLHPEDREKVKEIDIGYFIASVMRFYGMTLADVLTMPIYTFWKLYSYINRISSEEDLRQFTMLQNIIGGKPKEYVKQLQDHISEPIKYDETSELVFDKQGLNSLKQMLVSP